MGQLYNVFIVVHSWNRWLILVAGLITIIAAIINLSKKNESINYNKGIALTYVASLHFQLLIGLILYFVLSPLTKAAFNDFGNAMSNSGLRFWAVEHTILNLAGIIIAQIGYSKSKRKATLREKNKTILIWTIISLILILIVIPMGLMGVDRPWFRI